MNLYIAYYYNKETEQDAEVYIGKTGTEREFIDYWSNIYNCDIQKDDIIAIYPIQTAEDAESQRYDITISNIVD